MKKALPKANKNIQQTSLVIGVLLMLSGGIYLLINRAKKSPLQRKAPNSTNDNPTGYFRCTSNSYPLTFGTCHPDVKIIQRHLKSLGAVLGSFGSAIDGIDGRFGVLTLKAAQAKLGKASFDRTDVEALKQKV
ncbi:peptidoglycan-binding domain-containing protein [Flavilitoribacter nigricans]|uniref:Uncharacterized protein n=1 Tax=Flavilitoribacter nigricans (strain ATCC 23147 / DSM 23189 / NBRC 102662 / NCIMB 1420 / SS-2) TaxID=1122177 RepID=A0A2D0MY71_FLAN2|nr:hypothetical protein [Flavilitoribacter nigricans]PHN01130.1 hypothetical protein CRP01_38655 [Flavilitoribacter nigricans DSM 23189 = NBRC 102662]